MPTNPQQNPRCENHVAHSTVCRTGVTGLPLRVGNHRVRFARADHMTLFRAAPRRARASFARSLASSAVAFNRSSASRASVFKSAMTRSHVMARTCFRWLHALFPYLNPVVGFGSASHVFVRLVSWLPEIGGKLLLQTRGIDLRQTVRDCLQSYCSGHFLADGADFL